MKRLVYLLLLVAVLAGLALFRQAGDLRATTSLRIVSGSENEALEPIILDWGKAHRIDVQIDYLGSVDIARVLGQGTAGAYDAVWPANSLWIELGDTGKTVRYRTSILRSPVVLGLKRSLAERLGWIGRDDITIQMIQDAARDNAFRLAMTSATQSNSGASAYFRLSLCLRREPRHAWHGRHL